MAEIIPFPKSRSAEPPSDTFARERADWLKRERDQWAPAIVDPMAVARAMAAIFSEE
jgi:hypothetical protein